MTRYVSYQWLLDFSIGDTDIPPDEYELGNTYTYRDETYRVLHLVGYQNTFIVVPTDKLWIDEWVVIEDGDSKE